MHVLNDLLGLQAEKLTEYQMVLRGIIIFFVALALVRVAGIRTFGKSTAFDNLTALMLGAILGRAVVSNQSFFGSILATTVMMMLHRLVAWITYKNHTMGRILKGEPLTLMDETGFIEKNMSSAHMTKQDIEEALRLSLHFNQLHHIKEARIERSGEISLIKKPEQKD